MQDELALQCPPFRRRDQFAVNVAHRMQGAVQLILPEFEEAAHLRKVRRQIVILPDVGLEDRRMIGAISQRAGRAGTLTLTTILALGLIGCAAQQQTAATPAETALADDREAERPRGGAPVGVRGRDEYGVASG